MTPAGDDALAPGAPVTLRYHYRDGTPQAVRPMRVIEDRGDTIVAWLAPSTPIMNWATTDGGDPRDTPLADRFHQALGTARRVWQGPGIVTVIPLVEAYQVLHFRDSDGRFTGWYVNLEAPKQRHGSVLDSVDWHLDLIVGPNRTWEWKDEEEAHAAVQAGHLTAAELALARSTGERFLADLDHRIDEIGDWRAFTPPPAWTIPPLPTA